jgi:TetR/AcrR family tetracycline transcriptional repressor
VTVNAPRRAGRPRGDTGVDLRRIVEQAWALVDEDGMAGLSTRTLAARLHVKSPALYWHVRSKDELLSLMVEHLLQDSLAEIPDGLAWPDWLTQVARRQRALLLAHRDSGLIASLAPPTERMQAELFPRIMAPLLAGGLSSALASAAAGALAALVLGWVVYEQRAETREFMQAFHRPDEGFALALEAFVRGVAAAGREK